MPDATPMMQQYARIKDEHRDAILFFRLGDFYEMFRNDATEASHLLGLTLTSRQGVPMCGVPYHAAKGYIARLIRAGRKVAICEQVKQPDGKGLADREVVQVVTPGTVTEEDYLEATANNYLLSVAATPNRLSLAYLDLSTGEFGIASCPRSEAGVFLRRELARLQPSEVLVQESLLADDAVSRTLGEQARVLVNRFADWNFDPTASHERVCKLLGVLNLKAFGIDAGSPAPLAAGLLIDYVNDNTKSALAHVRSLRVDESRDCVGLDESTIRNLELVANLHDGSARYTVLETISFTRTAMGARLLRRWLLAPLRDPDEIRARQRQVTMLYRNQRELVRLRDELAHVLDLERLAGRVAMERAHAKDLVAIRTSLGHALSLAEVLSSGPLSELDYCREFGAKAREQAAHLHAELARSLLDEPSTLLTEGRLIRPGYNAELDRLHELRDNSRGVLEDYVSQEREATGIGSLKVRYNKIIGHYLEVTKSNAERVPPHFIRRQSLANSERFTTERLAELESALNDAAERIVDLERDLFLQIRTHVKESLAPILDLAASLSRLDVLQSLAHTATVRGYAAPRITNEERLLVASGRHPVVEAHLPSGSFVPNDIRLDTGDRFFALITGPNMAGKSTYLRQAALIALLAQIGGYVPADDAEIGVVDRIFCRVGASDNLARGESTFLVEMNEAAFILRTATSRSLVIMDEIGRGTSTNDGMAIAQAVTEYLAHSIRARTLFATHFHELTAIDAPGIVNLSLTVAEDGDRIVFLKQVREGPSNNSYGIHVARLAGVPLPVISRAQEVLEEILARKEPEIERPIRREPRLESSQVDLFEPGELILQELAVADLDEMRPVDALARMARWQEELSRRRNRSGE
ncbi:MAG: DNA mismatch repair protein MutS [Spirochaetota bacterium]